MVLHNVLAQAAAVVPAAASPGGGTSGSGWLDWINTKSAAVQVSEGVVVVVIAIGFIIFTGVRTKGSLPAILMALVVAGITVWGVFNIAILKDRAGGDLGSLAPSSSQQLVVDFGSSGAGDRL